MADAPDVHVRLFTREEAEKTLPLVKAIVRDIVADFEAFNRKSQELNAMAAKAPAKPSKDDAKAQQSLEEEVAGMKRRIAAAALELDELGIELRDCQLGLVDFPAKIGEDIAYLCWKFGEDNIRFWHGLSEGYAGRKLLQ